MADGDARMLEAALPWLAGRRLVLRGELPDALRPRADAWMDEKSEHATVLAWKAPAGELASGQFVVLVADGKAEAPAGCGVLLTQYLFADRDGITGSEPPLYWLDAEEGREALGTVIVGRL